MRWKVSAEPHHVTLMRGFVGRLESAGATMSDFSSSCVERHIVSVKLGATRPTLLNGQNGMKPAYGRKHLTTGAGAALTWMDRFVELEPEGGFRAVVQLQLNCNGGDCS